MQTIVFTIEHDLEDKNNYFGSVALLWVIGTRLLNSSIKLTTENIILSTTDMRIRKQTLHQL